MVLAPKVQHQGNYGIPLLRLAIFGVGCIGIQLVPVSGPGIADDPHGHIRIRIGLVLHAEEGNPDKPVLLVLGYTPLLFMELAVIFVDGASGFWGEFVLANEPFAIEEQDIDNVGKDIVVVL